MKKLTSAIILVASILLLTGCNPTANFMAAQEDQAKIGDPEYGFYFTLPEGWQITKQDKNLVTINYPTGRKLNKSEDNVEIEHKNIYLRLYEKDPEQEFPNWLEDEYLCYFCAGKKEQKSEKLSACKIVDITDTTRNAYCVRDEAISANFITNRAEPRNKVVVIEVGDYDDVRASYESETNFIKLMQSMRFE